MKYYSKTPPPAVLPTGEHVIDYVYLGNDTWFLVLHPRQAQGAA